MATMLILNRIRRKRALSSTGVEEQIQTYAQYSAYKISPSKVGLEKIISGKRVISHDIPKVLTRQDWERVKKIDRQDILKRKKYRKSIKAKIKKTKIRFKYNKAKIAKSKLIKRYKRQLAQSEYSFGKQSLLNFMKELSPERARNLAMSLKEKYGANFWDLAGLEDIQQPTAYVPPEDDLWYNRLLEGDTAPKEAWARLKVENPKRYDELK